MPEFPEKDTAYETSLADEVNEWQKMMLLVYKGELPNHVLRNIPAEVFGKIVSAYTEEERVLALLTVQEKRLHDNEAQKIGLEGIREGHKNFLLQARAGKLETGEVSRYLSELKTIIGSVENNELRQNLQSIADYWS